MIKLVSLLFSILFSIMFSYAVHSTTLLIVGDSLSAGYRMPVEKSWAQLLPTKLQKKGKHIKIIKIINASISGDTTGNGLARLVALLTQYQPNYVLIELGANDGLRGFSPTIIANNLNQMINHIKRKNGQAILMQIHVPTNYGKRYSQAFSRLYPTISEQQNIPLLPFYLEQVIIKPQWMMSDGLHPNVQAQPWIAEFMATVLSPLIE